MIVIRAVSIKIRCTIRSCILSVSNKIYMYKVNTISHSTLWTVHYYFLCQLHQLPPVIDASHTRLLHMSIGGPKLLKLIGWRRCPCFRWVPYIPGTTAQTPSAKPGRITRYYSNSNNTHCEYSGTVNR